MGNKDIDKAAREYATVVTEKPDPKRPGDAPLITIRVDKVIEAAFTSGAKWMQEQAQSEIDELIEALEEATRWISVSERLPEEGQEVLGYSPAWIDEDFNQTGVCLCYWNGEFDDAMWFRTKWDNDQDMWWPAEEAPTHWMQKPTIDTPKATQLLEKYGKK